MKVEWLPGALRSLDWQLDYIAARNLPAAIEVGDAVEAAALRLVDHPRLGRPGRVDDMRELAVAGTPLVIIYRIEDNAVLVLRVLHGAQLWPPRE
jgi:toxin ParE1/3/4